MDRRRFIVRSVGALATVGLGGSVVAKQLESRHGEQASVNLMCTFAGIGPSLPCSVVMFTRARSDTDVQCVAKTTHFPSALRLLRRSSAGAAEHT